MERAVDARENTTAFACHWRVRRRAPDVSAAAAFGCAPTDGYHRGGRFAAAQFTWTPIPQSQGYDLTVGITRYSTNLVNSGMLSASTTSYAVATLPVGKTLDATLYTELNGVWSRDQAITFTTGAALAGFSHPVAGQANLPTTMTFSLDDHLCRPALRPHGGHQAVGHKRGQH